MDNNVIIKIIKIHFPIFDQLDLIEALAEKSKIRAITMKETQLLTIPVQFVYDINKKYPSWQHFVIDTFSNRFDEMIHVLESVAFSNMYERITQHKSIVSL